MHARVICDLLTLKCASLKKEIKQVVYRYVSCENLSPKLVFWLTYKEGLWMLFSCASAVS